MANRRVVPTRDAPSPASSAPRAPPRPSALPLIHFRATARVRKGRTARKSRANLAASASVASAPAFGIASSAAGADAGGGCGPSSPGIAPRSAPSRLSASPPSSHRTGNRRRSSESDPPRGVGVDGASARSSPRRVPSAWARIVPPRPPPTRASASSSERSSNENASDMAFHRSPSATSLASTTAAAAVGAAPAGAPIVSRRAARPALKVLPKNGCVIVSMHERSRAREPLRPSPSASRSSDEALSRHVSAVRAARRGPRIPRRARPFGRGEHEQQGTQAAPARGCR